MRCNSDSQRIDWIGDEVMRFNPHWISMRAI